MKLIFMDLEGIEMLDVRKHDCMNAIMDSDQGRLEALLTVARKHHLSLDDLDDVSRDMDRITFTSWSQQLLRSVTANLEVA